jgi:D-alanyl-lipoteichoic acid acyltransferase DltB (MBOAT superfamily)
MCLIAVEVEPGHDKPSQCWLNQAEFIHMLLFGYCTYSCRLYIDFVWLIVLRHEL